MRTELRALRPWLVALCMLSLTACERRAESVETEADASEHAEEGEAGGEHGAAEDVVRLTPAQIAAAKITVAKVRIGSGGIVDVPGVIAADPARSAVVPAGVAGRIDAVRRNLGEAVKRGEALAVVDSREAADLTAELQAARSQLKLAESVLAREERLFAEKVTAEQDVLQARATAQEARIRHELAQQRLQTIGGNAETATSRLEIRAPIDGYVTSRTATVGQVVSAETALFEVATLDSVALNLSLPAEQASQIRRGATLLVTANGRTGNGRISFVAPVIDPATRQVPAIASIANADRQWRVGETVMASVQVASTEDEKLMFVPRAAIQTVEDKPSVFVATEEGFLVKHVRIGPAAGAEVAVLEGLTGEEQVAAQNSYVLKAELGKGEAADED